MRPLLLTRPQALSEEFARAVDAARPGQFAPIIAPLLEIKPEPGSIDLTGVQALLFSSRNAVAEFARRSTDRSVPALCVGDKTAREAQNHGFSALSAAGDVGALMALAAQAYLPEQGMLLHLRGAETAGDLIGGLLAEGIAAEERIIYDQRPLHLAPAAEALLATPDQVIAPVFSPRTAALLSDELLRLPVKAKILCIAMSRNVADRIDPTTCTRILTARSPDADAMLESVLEVEMPANTDHMSRQ